MSIEDDIAFFERVPMLGLLGRTALRILAIGAENRYVHSGEVLFSTGDAADCGYVVQEGSFSLKRSPTDDADEIIAGPGALLGELAMMTETVRPATAIAREPSSVIRISRSLFLKMLDGYPDAAHRLRDAISARTDQWAHEVQRVRQALDQLR